jgi:NhaP-type Na+/H+ and K+/H+ antiporter
VLTGVADLDQVLSGMYVGWIHHAAATAAVLRKGVVGTTFPILEAGANDPMAVSLLINLLQSAAS